MFYICLRIREYIHLRILDQPRLPATERVCKCGTIRTLIIMSVCQQCGASGSSEEPLATCDQCSTVLCKTCADLSSTELRAVALKKRSKSLTYLCSGCQPSRTDFRFAELRDSLLKLMRQQFDTFATSLTADISLQLESKISGLQAEVSVLRESNIDLIKLLTNQNLLLQRPVSCNALPGTSQAQSVTRQKSPTGSTGNLSVPLQRSGRSMSGSQRPPQPPNSSTSNPQSRTDSQYTGAASSGSSGLPKTVPLKSSHQGVGSAAGSVQGGSARWKRHSTFVVGCAKQVNSKVTAANIQRKTSVFVSRLDRTVSTDDLHEYLRSTFGADETFKLEEQTVKSGDYRSYRVEASLDLLDRLLDPAYWPENVYIKKFRFFRPRVSASHQ